MSPEQALEEARSGQLRPVYLVLGEEEYLRRQVVTALREAALRGGVPGLNDDRVVAGELAVERLLALVRTLPMLGPRRVVLVRELERWETAGSESGQPSPLDRLAEYVASPAPETVLLLVANRLDKRRRLVRAAQASGFLVACDPLPPRDLPRWIEQAVRTCGSKIARPVAELIAELVGPELGPVADAVERLCLYAGPRNITEQDVGECLVRIRTSSVWKLVDAIAERDLAAALGLLDEVFEPGEGPRLVGLLAWSTRQLLRFEAATRSGASAAEAARLAGAPPFRAHQLADQVARSNRSHLEAWLERLCGVDLALKGGSRRPARAILEYAIIAACRPAHGRSEPGGPRP